jgi:LDH2 family malate/lactate/ureidoglycolate dehydrogenase
MGGRTMRSPDKDSTEANTRYAAEDLVSFAKTLLERSGLTGSRAKTVAEILVEGDLLGHTTHGLQLLPGYLKEIQTKAMRVAGEPAVISDRGSVVLWDGKYLPGPWLVEQALNLCVERVVDHGVVTLVIRRSHHIACLSAYLLKVTERGLVVLLMSSDPSVKTVAPFGGRIPAYSPNPIAVGLPTKNAPILIDISMSCTANGPVQRLREQGKRLPHPWLIDNTGNASDEPAVLFASPPGSILPLGGTDLGYKGFALGLMVEALTSALGGYGRADGVTQWGGSIFIQVIDPNAFGNIEAFRRETEWLAETCRSNPNIIGYSAPRMPGSDGLKLRAEQIENGICLYQTILPALEPWSKQLDVPLPQPLMNQ